MLVAGTQTDRTRTEAEEPAGSGPVTEESAGNSPPPTAHKQTPPSTEQPAPPTASLEERVRRLEDIIATLQLAPPYRSEHSPTHLEQCPNDGILTSPRPASSAIKEDDAILPVSPRPPFSHRPEPWLLVVIYAELRAMSRMYFDPRYHMSWRSRLLIPLLIVGIVLSRMMIASVPLIGWLLDIVLFPVLLYVLIKVLSREATRYRATSPDLPPVLRL